MMDTIPRIVIFERFDRLQAVAKRAVWQWKYPEFDDPEAMMDLRDLLDEFNATSPRAETLVTALLDN